MSDEIFFHFIMSQKKKVLCASFPQAFESFLENVAIFYISHFWRLFS